MKMNRIPIFTAILLGMSLSCEKDSGLVENTLDEFRENKYYDSEIFTEPNLAIYGKWVLYAVSGGIHGGGHELNFDFLKINKYGIYGFIKDDSILEYGRIKIDEQANETLLITFVSDEKSETYMHDSEKYVHFYGNDTLSLDSPCCDRFNYHFTRGK